MNRKDENLYMSPKAPVSAEELSNPLMPGSAHANNCLISLLHPDDGCSCGFTKPKNKQKPSFENITALEFFDLLTREQDAIGLIEQFRDAVASEARNAVLKECYDAVKLKLGLTSRALPEILKLGTLKTSSKGEA